MNDMSSTLHHFNDDMWTKPIPLGSKGKPVYYGAYEKRCLSRLGYIVPFGRRMSRGEMLALGFSIAAESLYPR